MPIGHMPLKISHSNSVCGNTVVPGVLRLSSTYPVHNYLSPRHSAFITLGHCKVYLQQEQQKAIPVPPIKSAKQQCRIPSRFCNALAYTGCQLRHRGRIPLLYCNTSIQVDLFLPSQWSIKHRIPQSFLQRIL